jgi:protein-S-isoprenylcysteine O-methyltransferase Ste14
MSRFAVLAYGVLCYLVFFGTFLYAIGFVGGLPLPTSIDAGPEASPVEAILVDAALLGLFAVSHSVMARPAFKRWWTRLVPPPVERSTYVLFSSLALALLFWQWRPIPGIVWEANEPFVRLPLLALFWLGWIIALVSTFLINHFDLFGLRQVWLYARGQPYQPPAFQKPIVYRWVRHPIMLGFLIAFWATPRMTWGHLLFAVATTGYIFVGILLEERDLLHAHGDTYAAYRRQVSMIVPWPPAPD